MYSKTSRNDFVEALSKELVEKIYDLLEEVGQELGESESIFLKDDLVSLINETYDEYLGDL